MKELPAGFPTDALVEALESHWNFSVRQMEYVPVGFGGHHWRASSACTGGLFVSVHELDLVGRSRGSRADNFEVLRRALGTARWLESDTGLDFVLAPLVDLRGRTVVLVEDAYAMHIYPWIECEALDDPDGVEGAELIARLHQVPRGGIPVDLLKEEDFMLPHRDALEDALQDVAVCWETGPYAEPARKHLRAHEDMVRALMDYYDRMAALAARDESDWVITHGEPNGANLIRDGAGRVRLIDWDSLLVAPPERDLWELPRNGLAIHKYERLARREIDARSLRLYEAWYALAEVAVYLTVFRSPHTADQNVVQSWVNYLQFLPNAEQWPELPRTD